MPAHTQSRRQVRLDALLGSWRPAAVPLIELRRLHAAALNEAVARTCIELDREQVLKYAEPARLLERAARSTWTAPELAFAHYVDLRVARPVEPVFAGAVRSLARVCGRREPPPALFGGSPQESEWKGFGLTTLVADYRRDGRELDFHAARGASSDVAACRAALGILRGVWPQMAFTVTALVREVVWYVTATGVGSGTLFQAYGAVFLARGHTRVEALERLVHEATHLEVIARLALDKTVVNGQTRERSPFRDRPRPLTQVLHAALVAARVVEAFERSIDAFPPRERDSAAGIQGRYAASLATAMESLEHSAEWTPLGQRLFEDLTAHSERVARVPA